MIYKNGITGKKNNMYTFGIYNKNGTENSKLIGDIYEGSLMDPKSGISYFAYFSNEPSEGQTSNSEIDINTAQNYKNRKTLKVGDTVVYKLRASRDIAPGEEVVWCYGDDYVRDYVANC